MSETTAQDLPNEPAAASGPRRRRRGHGWSQRKSHVAEPSQRPPGRPAGSVNGMALMVKELPDPEWREVMSNPMTWVWDNDWRSIFLRELYIYKAMGLLAPRRLSCSRLLPRPHTCCRIEAPSEANKLSRLTEDIKALMR